MKNLIIKHSKIPLSFADRLHQYQNAKEKIFHQKSDISIDGKKLVALQRNFFHYDSDSIYKLVKNELLDEEILISKITSKSTGHALYKISSKSGEYILRINILSSYFTDISFYLERYCQDHVLHKVSPSLLTTVINVSRKEYPFDYMITACAAGENLEKHNDHNVFKIYKRLGKIMARVHSVNYSKFGHPNYQQLIFDGILEGTSSSWLDFFFINLERHLQKMKELNFFNEYEKKYSAKLFESNKHLLEKVKCSFLHNDLGGRNIIAMKNKLTGIIDWEDAIMGDPQWELAFIDTFMVGKSSDKGFFEAFCEGYGIDIKSLHMQPKYWMYYLRVAMIKAISRSLTGYYNAEGREIDRWRIKNGMENFRRLSI